MMRHRGSLFCLFAGTVVLLAAAPAKADPVVIRSGSFSYDTGDPASFLVSGDGFTLRWSGFDELTVTSVSSSSLCIVNCVAGTPVDFSTAFGLTADVSPVAGTVNGTAYDRLLLAGNLDFSSVPLLFPASTDTSVVLTQPFLFRAHFTATDPASGGATVFDADLIGRGTARLVTFGCADAECREGGPPYSFVGVNYTFTDAVPTPEPATMMLLGGGLLAVVVRRRRPRA